MQMPGQACGHSSIYASVVLRRSVDWIPLRNDLIVREDANANQQVRVHDHFLGGEHAISYVQPGSGFGRQPRTAHYDLAATP